MTTSAQFCDKKASLLWVVSAAHANITDLHGYVNQKAKQCIQATSTHGYTIQFMPTGPNTASGCIAAQFCIQISIVGFYVCLKKLRTNTYIFRKQLLASSKLASLLWDPLWPVLWDPFMRPSMARNINPHIQKMRAIKTLSSKSWDLEIQYIFWVLSCFPIFFCNLVG